MQPVWHHHDNVVQILTVKNGQCPGHDRWQLGPQMKDLSS